MYDVARGHHTDGTNDGGNGYDVEDDFFVRHAPGSTVTVSPREIRPPVVTVTATPTAGSSLPTAGMSTRWGSATVRRIAGSFGRSPCGSVVMTQRTIVSITWRRTPLPAFSGLPIPAASTNPPSAPLAALTQ